MSKNPTPIAQEKEILIQLTGQALRGYCGKNHNPHATIRPKKDGESAYEAAKAALEKIKENFN